MDKEIISFLVVLAFAVGCLIVWGIAYRKEEERNYPRKLIWIFPLCPFLNKKQLWCFIGVTFISHTITDYFTSRLNSKLWKEGKVHSFFVSIGFDQLLHFTQLLLTYQYIS